MKSQQKLLAALAAFTLTHGAVAQSPATAASAASPPSTSAEQVGEFRPGLLRGYLDPKQLPNSLALLPPPPAKDTPAAAADDAAFRATRSLKGTARWTLAAQDASLAFPKTVAGFACALGVTVSPEKTPHLTMLLRRSLTDAGLATYRAKEHYQRQRPFAAHQDSTCTPDEDVKLATDGSYPSGHTALGWAWALLLAELAPERADALLARGYAFGQSRVICGAHWQSDVEAGRLIGAATVARLHADPVFQAQLAAAAQEVKAARSRPDAMPADCTLEAASLQPTQAMSEASKQK